MSYTTVVCVLVCCDECRQVLEWEGGHLWHPISDEEAAESARAVGWTVTDRTQLCASCAEAPLDHGRPSELTPWLDADGLPPALVDGEGLAGFGR